MKKFMKKAQRNPISYILLIIVLLSCLLLIVKNISQKKFFYAEAIDILTLITGTIIVFYLSEGMTDQRRRNDCIEHVIMEIEKYVTDDENYKNNKNSLLHQASCANRIKYLKDASFHDISSDISFIETHFNEIRDLYSNHYTNEEELLKVSIDIDKHRDLIIDKCSKIRIGLYS